MQPSIGPFTTLTLSVSTQVRTKDIRGCNWMAERGDPDLLTLH